MIGSAEESGEATGILGMAGRGGAVVAGKTVRRSSPRSCGEARSTSGVDSAAPHIASALGTPTLTIFGPSDWRAWVVPDDLHRVVEPDMPCVPCHKKGCERKGRSVCLEELPAEKVLRAAGEMLRAAAPRSTPAAR